MRISRRIGSIAQPAAFGMAGTLAAVGIWWALALNASAYLIPKPPEVWDALRQDFWSIPALEALNLDPGGILSNVVYTMNTVFLGVAVGTAVGIAVGTLIARFRIAKEVLEPPLLVMGTVPVMIVLPFLLIWFGTARFAQAGLVIFYAMLLVTTVTQNAVQNVIGHFEKCALTMGAGRFYIVRHVLVPAVVPEVIGAVRLTLGAGWGFAAVAELLGAPRGAGRLIQAFTISTSTADIIAVLVCVGLLAVAVDAAVAAFGGWIGRWRMV